MVKTFADDNHDRDKDNIEMVIVTMLLLMEKMGIIKTRAIIKWRRNVTLLICEIRVNLKSMKTRRVMIILMMMFIIIITIMTVL